jgi:anaerobic ribonucleoside-triphosphate reductase activating protein
MQGCAHNCEGCHNPATHNYHGGGVLSFDQILADLSQHKYIKGVTFSGGEPLDQPEQLAALIEELKTRGYHVVIFTGYRYEEVLQSPSKFAAAKQADILIDGPYIAAQKTLNIPFRGSANQRMIDMQASIATGEVVEI